ncbi:MAG TPA: Ig-like domain-containing protein, partial [Burkholderiaceae bacterium]|nr:Ig-like domain-containing protein [Burkholderiaceae bacterium]
AIAPGVLASHVAVGDVDGDGRKDLVIGYAPYDPVAHLAIFHQNADGSFAAPVISDVASELTSLEVGDANHDGRTDILLLHRVTLGVVLQNAAGGRDAESLVALPDNAGGHSKLGFTAADIDGDGAVDVAYTQVGSQGAVTVLLGTPPVTNRPPVAVGDTVTVKCNDGIAIPVLANDSDPDGDTITVVSVTAPRHGTTKILPNGKVLYDPVKRYRGADRFLYVISDGHGHFAQTGVNVTVK